MPDKFKGSLSAHRVCEAIEAGVRTHFPQAAFRRFAASDGGDGFLDAVAAVRTLQRHAEPVSDPLGRPVTAEYLYDPASGEAFVELAQASGLVLLAEGERDPLRTSTLGTGELMHAALARGARTVYVGLGGSATSDAGLGIAAAFGYTIFDQNDQSLEPVGGNLARVARIGLPEKGPLPEGVRVVAVNDVTNPLWGPEGAAYTYGPQKGAGPQAVEALDRGLRNLDGVVLRQLGLDYGKVPGAGAAGGAAYGLKAFLGADFVNGTEYIIRVSGLEASLQNRPADLLITGEGRIDSQSLSGKLIQGVLRLGAQHGIPVLAVCGRSELDAETLRTAGFEAVIETADPDRPLAWNLEHAFDRISQVVADYFAKGRNGN